jgi:hypothetical protein
VGSNPADDSGLLRAMKSVGGEVKPSAPCRNILRRMLKSPAEYERDISSAKFTAISLQVSPCFATRCLLVTARELWWMNHE